MQGSEVNYWKTVRDLRDEVKALTRALMDCQDKVDELRLIYVEPQLRKMEEAEDGE